MNRALAILLLFGAPALADSRTWTDASGKHQVSAELADFQGGVAYLKKDSGTIAAVPLAKLSNADQEFIRSATPAVKIVEGKVIGIADGDTLTVLDASTPTKIRLEGIDAPEGHQAYGTKSKQALAAKVFQKTVRVEWREHDKYNRTLGHVFVDGRWVNRDLVQEGWAWHYREYSKSEVLAEAESDARTGKVGLWADKDPIPPWEFRHNEVADKKAEPESKPDPPETARAPPHRLVPETPTKQQEITVYVTRTGAKYHQDGCRYLSKSKIAMSLSEAAKRYTPCSVCRPPSAGSQASADQDEPEPVASVPVYTPPSSSGGTVHVKGYYRKDGTYVRPHTRRAPRRR